MKTPPMLLGAGLIFWGWQGDFLVPALAMAVILESARFVTARWEFSDEDFSRLWTFCALLFLVAAVYAFTNSGATSEMRGLLSDPGSFLRHRNAGLTSARTAAAIFRWLPMLFFLLIASQLYSSRGALPLTMLWFVRRRWRKAAQLGKPLPASRDFNISYLYFALCLFAASIHPGEDDSYFWGLCALMTWALWPHRSHRFGIVAWGTVLIVAFTLGFGGQAGIGRLQGYLESLQSKLLGNIKPKGFDAAQTKTMLGQIGLAKGSGEIVIRLQSKHGATTPSYLREASYRIYKSPAWFAGASRGDFGGILSTNDTTWILLPDKTNSSTVTIACYLPDGKALLPVPPGCGRLENLPIYILEANSAGALLAHGPGMVVFDAWYGPGATIDSAPNTLDDLQTSQREEAALDAVISELQLKGKDDAQTIQAINRFFQSQFTYSLWQGPDLINTNQTPLSRFLLETRSGHCEYFATATVQLLRRLKIPARYAVGYFVHETSGEGFVVRQRDAHAWCLVWDKDTRTWRNFDTTPASWVGEEGKRASAWQRLGDFWSWIKFQFSKVRWGQTHLREYLLLGLVPVLGLLLYQIFFRRKRRHRPAPAPEPRIDWPGHDSEFYLIEGKLAERGVDRRPNEPLADWVRRALKEPALADVNAPLRDLLHLHYRYRFDPRGLSQTDREELRREARRCLESLAPARA